MDENIRFVVLLTIDRHEPGTDVTALYDADTLARLVEEGYIEADKPKAAKSRKRGS